MKFGRFHGIALFVLGLLLLLAQGLLVPRHSAPQENQPPAETSDSRFPFMAVAGLMASLSGGVLIATQTKKTLSEELGTDESGRVHREESEKRRSSAEFTPSPHLLIHQLTFRRGPMLSL